MADIVDMVIDCFKAHRVDNGIEGKHYIFPARMVTDASVEKFVKMIEEERRKRIAEISIASVNAILDELNNELDDSEIEQ